MYNIVTVDDERMIKRGLRAIIESAGEQFRVVGEASNGREALEMVVREVPHMLITDISMPEMDGLELAAEVSRLYPQIAIVILSGYGEFQYAQEALRYRVKDYLLKPIQPEELTRIIVRGREEHYRAKDKLAQESRRLLERIGQIEGIADSLWQMDKAAADAKLARLCGEIGQDAAGEPGWAERVYSDLLALLLGKLGEKSGREWPAETVGRAETDLAIHPERFEACLREACDKLLERIAEQRNPGQRRVIQKALAFIEAEYANARLLMQDVTDHIAISPTYFSRLFKEETGATFVQYLTELRMKRAKELLADPEAKIFVIAEEVGYSDYHHFAKSFKKHTGMTPKDYRRARGAD